MSRGGEAARIRDALQHVRGELGGGDGGGKRRGVLCARSCLRPSFLIHALMGMHSPFLRNEAAAAAARYEWDEGRRAVHTAKDALSTRIDDS